MLPTAASFVPINRATTPSSATAGAPSPSSSNSLAAARNVNLSSASFNTHGSDHSSGSGLLAPNGLANAFSISSSSVSPSSSSSSPFVTLGSSPSNVGFEPAARPYTSLDSNPRSWRDASASAEVLYAPAPQRNAFASSSSSSSSAATGPMWDPAPGSRPTPIGSGRQTPIANSNNSINHSSNGLSSSVGAIGDGRRVGPSPEKRMEHALAGLAGVFDVDRSSGANSPLQGLGGGNRSLTPSSQQMQLGGDDDSSSLSFGTVRPGGGIVRSRPSSFILGVLPSRTDDRHRTASERSSSSPLPSPSHDKISFDLDAAPGADNSSSSIVLHSSPPSTSPSLTAHTEATPRAPTPSRSPSPGIRRRPLFSGNDDGNSIDARVQSLEATVYDLSSFVHNEMRSLRDEVYTLRGLVQQIIGGGGGGGTHNSTLNGNNGRFGQHLGPSTPKDVFESPLLTVRSPSPPLQPSPGLRPMPIRTASGSFLSSAGSANSIHSSASSPALSSSGNFFPDHLFDNNSASSDLVPQQKDEQIAALSQQVNSLASSVAQLMNGSTPQGSPLLMSGGGGPGSALLGTGGMRSQTMPATTGLGVSLSLSNSSAYSRELGSGGRSPLMRPHSSNGSGNNLTRAGSLGKGFSSRSPGRANGAGNGTADFGEWDSPVMGSSPMLGGSTGTAPPGSLGSKWDVLGVGNELFRAIAKYGLGPPTKIQAKAIPCVLRNQDIVAQAPAIQERIQCYVIPALQLLHSLASTAVISSTPSVQVLIITATVDQAAQAQRLAVGLGATLGLRTSLFVGQPSGDSSQDAREWLSAPTQVVVGTPHRLHDLLATRLMPLHDLRLLVIDECDQLIARNLSEPVTNIVRLLPPSLASNGPGGASVASSNGGGPPSPVIARSPLLGPSAGALPGGFAPPGSSPWSHPPSAPSSSGVDRQTAIYSCTVPQDVLNFASSLQLREPVRVLVRREAAGGDRGETTLGGGGSNSTAASSTGSLSHQSNNNNSNSSGLPPSVIPSSIANLRNVRQFYFYVAVGGTKLPKGMRRDGAVGAGGASREWKLEAVCDVVEDSGVDAIVIFCSSVDNVEAVTYKLGSRGIESFALHQDMGQPMRQNTLARFRAPANPNLNGGGTTPRLGAKRCLVVCDPHCRPLSDAHQVPLVINFDLPRAVEDYVHRIAGPNAAFGRPGITINFVTPGADVEMLRAIESYHRCKIAELPTSFAIGGGY